MPEPINTTRIEGRMQRTAATYPDRTAFVCKEQSLSFSELSDRTNRLAATLSAHDLCADYRIGIFMFKSIEMPVAVYGVLASGCVYVPLDPLTRPERLQQIIEDCDIRCLICDRHTIKTIRSLAASPDLFVIGDFPVETVSDEIMQPSLSWKQVFSAQNTAATKTQELSDNAYIIYTSGSTGRPKGILHTHTSALAYVDACIDTWNFTPEDHFANHSPLHFDMATMEFLVAPIVGASTTLVTEDVMKMPASISQLLELQGISVWYSVPFALIQLVESGVLHGRELKGLRKVIFAGEAFPVPKLKQLCELLPDVEFSNAYGPTETNVCTVYTLDRNVLEQVAAVPIGDAWSQSSVWIENDRGEEAAVDEIGELLVSGPTVMTEYWGRPDLNEACFVTHAQSSQTYYKTGDLVHRDKDGVLHLHGRRDRQIKHRGFRIELDEIENVLHEHSAVSSAAALKHPHLDELIAFVVFRDNEVAAMKELRKLLRDRLPVYAIPNRVLTCEALPLSTNSKIDRVALARAVTKLDTNTQPQRLDF